ncbi:DUF5082 domain-containing protein [Caldibacillus lycopersici]|uniref:DUF5082 domain-containing protein n=1 Tax=Perspicuibacillus lycopersici TaxID=1325689 RepID=A0AAE3IUK7_9BACI|nr:DUF5082 domain-containing protein [Perspicuibacillus lycopersici]MCU9614791.1 DUF5082 domain-containing protein [Perspicuibacillus lycopersici]
MSFSRALDDIQVIISYQYSDVDDQLTRLRQTKAKLFKELETSRKEIQQMLQPELAEQWTGNRSNEFTTYREEAYQTTVQTIQYEFHQYLEQIDSEILRLESKRNFLTYLSSYSVEMEALVAKDVVTAEVEEKLSQLKRWVFIGTN